VAESQRNAEQVFDEWALDYHAEGMEKGHWNSVKAAFELIPSSSGNYLEIGVGNGYGINHISLNQYKGGFCYGLDISENMVKCAQKRTENQSNVKLESADFLSWLPVGDVKFSCIFSMEVFYYFTDIKSGIEKAVSLLATGGSLMVMVNYHEQNPECFTWPDELGTPMILWGRDDYLKAFKDAGLTEVTQLNLPDNSVESGSLCTFGKKL